MKLRIPGFIPASEWEAKEAEAHLGQIANAAWFEARAESVKITPLYSDEDQPPVEALQAQAMIDPIKRAIAENRETDSMMNNPTYAALMAKVLKQITG